MHPAGDGGWIHDTAFRGRDLGWRWVVGDRKRENGLAACAIIAVSELQRSAMCLGDLAAQRKPDAAAAVLGREKWNKQIVALGKAGPFIKNEDLHRARIRTPTDLYTAGLAEGIVESSIHGIPNQ